ncbi:glycosyltransferase family 2 protein [Agromyces sp. CCNWLW203]|uniref:glycosyltransferase family 2 protein n=1 Tax=Agromyces sp. CCNWLW203 TaxID=3112842 RepID=UPI002F9677A4
MPSLVSIVIPAYNNADYLAETLESVLAQTYQRLEVIVADHASTDRTWEVMEGYAGDPRITLLRTEAGGGALRNWNRVSQAATGTYLKLVCGDDLIAPESVAKQVAALESNPGAVLAASARDLIDASGRPFVRARGLAGLLGRHGGGDAIRRSVRRGTNIFGEPGCVMMRRDVLERVGWWDSRFPYLIDQATYSRVLLEGDFVGVDGSLAAFRVSSSQWSVRLVREQAEQTVGYNAWLADEHPEVISRSDQRIGDVRARLMARTRQLAYAYLGRRMSRAVVDAPAEAS